MTPDPKRKTINPVQRFYTGATAVLPWLDVVVP